MPLAIMCRLARLVGPRPVWDTARRGPRIARITTPIGLVFCANNFMNNLKKILILNNLGILIVISLLSYFFWSLIKKPAPISVPPGFSLNYSSDPFPSTQADSIDPSSGNSGEVKISLKKSGDSIEVFWPSEYQIYSLVLKNLGETETADDNKTILGFTANVSQNRLIPGAGAVIAERVKIEPPIAISPAFFENQELLKKITLISSQNDFILKNNQRYSIELLFGKEGGDRIYTGLLGFTY